MGKSTIVEFIFFQEFAFLICINHHDELRFRGESVCSECCLLMINVCFWQIINQLNSHIDNFNFNVTCHSINHSYRELLPSLISKYYFEQFYQNIQWIFDAKKNVCGSHRNMKIQLEDIRHEVNRCISKEILAITGSNVCPYLLTALTRKKVVSKIITIFWKYRLNYIHGQLSNCIFIRIYCSSLFLFIYYWNTMLLEWINEMVKILK